MGIGLPFILLGTTYAVSGFSYGLGSTCFVNHEHSFAIFWGWLVGIACASLLVQLATTAYCMYVFVVSRRLGNTPWPKSNDPRVSPLEVVNADKSHISLTDKRRIQWTGIRTMLSVQWRTILLAIALVIEGLYFSSMSWAAERKGASITQNPQAIQFGECLAFNHGNKDPCLQYTSSLTVSKNATLAGIGVMAVGALRRNMMTSLSNVHGISSLECRLFCSFATHTCLLAGTFSSRTLAMFWQERLQNRPGANRSSSSSLSGTFQLLRVVHLRQGTPNPETLHSHSKHASGASSLNSKIKQPTKLLEMARQMGLDVDLQATETGVVGKISHSSQPSHTSKKSSLNLDKPVPPPPTEEQAEVGRWGWLAWRSRRRLRYPSTSWSRG